VTTDLQTLQLALKQDTFVAQLGSAWLLQADALRSDGWRQ